MNEQELRNIIMESVKRVLKEMGDPDEAAKEEIAEALVKAGYGSEGASMDSLFSDLELMSDREYYALASTLSDNARAWLKKTYGG